MWLDLDATDELLHGAPEGRFFHGNYKSYCYLPRYIFSGEHLLCARLRPPNIASCRSLKMPVQIEIGNADYFIFLYKRRKVGATASQV